MTMDPAALAAATARLSEYDFTVLVDASGSMGEDDNTGQSRWTRVQETARQFCREVDAIDTDGINLIFFGQAVKLHEGVHAGDISRLFDAHGAPRGSTPTADALRTALGAKSTKKKFLLCFTDGEPDSKGEVEDVIRAQSNRQTADDECTILFIQVGTAAGAKAWLTMLDDNLKGAKFDIVDAKTVEEANKFASIVELVAHAIND